MEFDRVVAERRSNRKFKPDPLSDEQVNQILEAARLAPSGSNVQPWRFVVVKSAEMREEFSVVSRFKFVFRAPVVFVCCYDITAVEKRDQRITELVGASVFTDVEMDTDIVTLTSGSSVGATQMKMSMTMNVAIAIEHMALKAADLGLGSCWVGGFDGKQTRAILGLSDKIYPMMLLPVGYPENNPSARPRLPVEDLILKTI